MPFIIIMRTLWFTLYLTCFKVIYIPFISKLFNIHTSSAESQKGAIADQRCWEPEGRYCHRLCTAIATFWFSMEHLWAAITPFWLSTDDIFFTLLYSATSIAGNTGHLMGQMRTREDAGWTVLHNEVLTLIRGHYRYYIITIINVLAIDMHFHTYIYTGHMIL